MRAAVLAAFLAAASISGSAAAQSVCADHADGGALDFWVGSWRVTSPDGVQVYGRNRIEKALGGCAIFEHWSGAAGDEGKSLFTFDARSGEWEQTWVTGNTARPGGLKHKKLVLLTDEGGARFQGAYPGGEDGVTISDRTTLTPLENGAVRQHIEISLDGGGTWRTTFDAIYWPAE